MTQTITQATQTLSPLVSNPGSQWLETARIIKQSEMSPLGLAVAQLLNDVWHGIYHMDESALKKVDWKNSHYMQIALGWQSMSTFDGGNLTLLMLRTYDLAELIMRAHDLLLRVEISPCNFTHLNLMFHLRTARTGEISQRMPTIEDHLRRLRTRFPVAEAQQETEV